MPATLKITARDSTSVIASALKVASGGSSNSSSAASELQEASEAEATTIKEAQSGDPVAKALLQRIQAKQQAQQQALESKASEPGKGETVDKAA